MRGEDEGRFIKVKRREEVWGGEVIEVSVKDGSKRKWNCIKRIKRK